MDAPLAGILVADLTQNVAGPTCTQILGDLGAEVVKVERPGRGDDARAWAPPYWGEESATFMSVNRNKRSLAVDVKQPDGRAIVERLVSRADVFVQSLRAGAVSELGLGWERASALNPRLVYCSVTAFGTEGPLADRPGYDPLMQALGGIMSVNGHPGQPPARVACESSARHAIRPSWPWHSFPSHSSALDVPASRPCVRRLRACARAWPRVWPLSGACARA